MAYQITPMKAAWKKLRLNISFIYYTLLYMTSLDSTTQSYNTLRTMPLDMMLNKDEMSAINTLLSEIFPGMTATLVADGQYCKITYSTFTGNNAGAHHNNEVNAASIADRLYVQTQATCLAQWGDAQTPSQIMKLSYNELQTYKKELLYLATMGEYPICPDKKSFLANNDLSTFYPEDTSSPVTSPSPVRNVMRTCTKCNKVSNEKEHKKISCCRQYLMCNDCIHEIIIKEAGQRKMAAVSFDCATIKCLYCFEHPRVSGISIP